MRTEPLTPDVVRALIAEAELWPVNARAYEVHSLIARLASALSDFLPREDADLEAIESRAAWAGSYSTDGVQAAAERFRIARVDVPALIGRVRTAEAAPTARDVLLWLDARMSAEELDQAAEHFGIDVEWSSRDTARECGNDSHHGYGTGYCGDCEKEGERG